MSRRLSVAIFVLLVCAAAAAAPITLRVDATSAPGKIFRAHLTMPVNPGPLTLYYPKWIPGEHGPTGPITGLAGLKFSAGGKSVAWKRDPLEMYAIHVDVPDGASALEADLDYLAPTGAAMFSAGPTTSAKLALLSWNTVLLYPQTPSSDALLYETTLRIPSGWKYATALETKSGGEEIQFGTVSLTCLVDSPVLMSAEMNRVEIASRGNIRHTIDIASENPFAIRTPDDFARQYSKMVEEAGALFGARHYRHYDWLLTLSDHVAHFGLEHHESSDDRLGEDALKEENGRKGLAGLLAHEYVHSWNGKYRRPAGLSVSSYEKPMSGELLWVYEGLTQYLGELLPLRSGIWTAEEYREVLASTAALMTAQGGRTWRPLLDTAVAAQTLYGSPAAWRALRRGVDFYDESVLLWLDVDMTIRGLTGGKKSLDDFCRAFYGGSSGTPELKPYAYDDVVSTLNAVAANDWKSFLDRRLSSLERTPPMGGIEASGWRLVYSDTPNKMFERMEQTSKSQLLATSIGVTLRDDGGIIDVVPESPAARSGLAPGDRVVAANGRRYTKDWLKEVVKASVSNKSSIELIVQNGDDFATRSVDYHEGLRYPHLERVSSKPDLLEQLKKPLAK